MRDELERGTLDVPVDYDDPSRQLPLVPRAPAGGRPGRQDRHAAREPRWSRRLGGAVRGAGRGTVRRRAPRPVRHRRVGSSRHVRHRAGDRLHRRLRRPRRARHHAGHPRRAPSGRRPLRDFQEACAARNAAIIQHVGTNDSARDMDSIRRALGEDEISYFGFSYGSELGATWATTFPDTVRAAVLDGAKDPNASGVAWERKQSAGFEQALDSYLAACSRDRDSTFHNGGNATDHLLETQPAGRNPSTPAAKRQRYHQSSASKSRGSRSHRPAARSAAATGSGPSHAHPSGRSASSHPGPSPVPGRARDLPDRRQRPGCPEAEDGGARHGVRLPVIGQCAISRGESRHRLVPRARPSSRASAPDRSDAVR